MYYTGLTRIDEWGGSSNLLHVAIDGNFALFQQLQNLCKCYKLDDNIDLISKLVSEVIVATTFHNIQGSGILHEKHFAGRNFAFLERKVVLNKVYEVVLTQPAFGSRFWGNFLLPTEPHRGWASSIHACAYLGVERQLA